MKKILQVFTILATLLVFTAMCSAIDKIEVNQNRELSAINRIAIGMPMYYPPDDEAPTADELMRTMFEASHSAKQLILSYDDIASNIKRDKGIDIKVLPRKKAAKIYSENVGNYADAVVVATIAFSGKRIKVFYDVSDAKTFEMLCDYQVAGTKTDPWSLLLFKEMCQDFYSNFNRAVERQVKDREKNEKDAVKKALEKSKELENKELQKELKK